MSTSEIQLVRLRAGLYETPDHQWQVRHNDGSGCAPRSWWLLFCRGVRFPIQAQSLRAAKALIGRVPDW